MHVHSIRAGRQRVSFWSAVVKTSVELSRRDALVAIAAIASAVIAGCANFGRQSDLESTTGDLDALLQTIEDDEELSQLVSLLGRDARKLVEEQAVFAFEFNRIAADRSSRDETLVELFTSYERKRVALRGELLRTQDAIEAAWPEESRDEMRAIVNRKAGEIVPQRRQGG